MMKRLAFLALALLAVSTAWAQSTPGVGFNAFPGKPLVWFFSPSNIEMLVKVLDACVPGFDRYWVFYAATTNVEFTVTVTDTITGDVKTYHNELGRAATPVQDTGAFATCHP